MKALLLGLCVSLLSPSAFAGPSDNAALAYWRGFSALVELEDLRSPAGKAPAKSEPGRPLPELMRAVLADETPYDPRLSPLLEANRFALSELRRGAGMPRCDFGLTLDGNPLQELPHFGPWRSLFKLLLLSARRALAEGRPEAALADAKLSLAIVGHATSHPLLVAMLIASRFADDSLDLLERIQTAHPDQTAAIRALLSKARRPLVDWRGGLEEEAKLHAWLTTLREREGTRGLLTWLVRHVNDIEPTPTLDGLARQLGLEATGAAAIDAAIDAQLADYEGAWGALIAAANSPQAERLSRMKACEERFPNKANEGFSLTVILMPALSRAVTSSAKRRARRARLEARR